MLGLHKLTANISSKYKIAYDFDSILSRLIYSRIIFPASKLSTFSESKNFLNNLIFNYSMFIVLLILLLKKTRICNPSSTKTAAHFLSVMTAYYSMIAQTSSLKANPSLAFDNMAVLKNTGLLLL